MQPARQMGLERPGCVPTRRGSGHCVSSVSKLLKAEQSVEAVRRRDQNTRLPGLPGVRRGMCTAKTILLRWYSCSAELASRAKQCVFKYVDTRHDAVTRTGESTR